METEKTIITRIPIEDIIKKTLEKKPDSVCEFNNLLGYNAVDLLLEDLNLQLNESNKLKGGKGRKRKTKINKKKGYKKTRKIRKQKGGADPRTVIFFMSMFLVFVHGIKNMTHIEVTNRLKDSMKVIDIFKNYYGTCAANSLLFLKTIDLPTFEELSVEIMEHRQGMTAMQMSSYLNKELNFNTKWYSFTGRKGLDEEASIDRYVELLKNKLIGLRNVYDFDRNQDILTSLNYPSKKGSYHAVVLWLTNKDEIVIIDPQRYYVEGKIMLYTSEAYLDKYMDNDKELILYPIQTYIRERIDVTSDYRDTKMLESLHIEIDDVKNKNKFSPYNKNLQDTIGKIRAEEEKLIDKTRIEF
jgi:hypothetical protein